MCGTICQFPRHGVVELVRFGECWLDFCMRRTPILVGMFGEPSENHDPPGDRLAVPLGGDHHCVLGLPGGFAGNEMARGGQARAFRRLWGAGHGHHPASGAFAVADDRRRGGDPAGLGLRPGRRVPAEPDHFPAVRVGRLAGGHDRGLHRRAAVCALDEIPPVDGNTGPV